MPAPGSWLSSSFVGFDGCISQRFGIAGRGACGFTWGFCRAWLVSEDVFLNGAKVGLKLNGICIYGYIYIYMIYNIVDIADNFFWFGDQVCKHSILYFKDHRWQGLIGVRSMAVM